MQSDLPDEFQHAGLFLHADVEALQYLLDDCQRLRIVSGTTLLAPGDENHNVYIVIRGALNVYLRCEDTTAHSVVGVGECVGELSLIDGRGVSAVVVAAADSELLVVPREILWSLIDRSHAFARNLLVILSGRIRDDNQALVMTADRSLEFERAASVDPLTGLHNRRWLADAFARAIQRCEIDGDPLCLLLVDIDGFKELNDRHGHLVGDAVLHAVARQLAEALRSPELIARYGGDEIMILLARTGLEEARRVAERLRFAVETLPLADVTDGAVGKITISCGIATLGDNLSLVSLIGAADAALYRAKANGRNRVEGP